MIFEVLRIRPEQISCFMDLFLLRHGQAVERGTHGYEDDATRPLTSKGRRQLRRVARAMAAMNLQFDMLLTSPLLRARETAEIVATSLKAGKKLKLMDSLAADREPTELTRSLQKLKPAPESILLVGHEPFLSQLVSIWVTGGSNLAMDFPKAGLCKLELEKLQPGKCARLAWLVTPQQMKRMKAKR
jgi:phosphohistidine phosphatase